jgi:hypothetical protein
MIPLSLSTEFHVPKSDGLFVIAIKLKAKYFYFHVCCVIVLNSRNILVFYILENITNGSFTDVLPFVI